MVASATALTSVFGEWVDPNLRALCTAYLKGEATFFGMEQHEPGVHKALTRMIEAHGVDVEAMEAHYYRLGGE